MGRTREFDIEVATRRAMQVFWSRGYEATSIPDLVEATGVQRGSLYAAFGSKHDLYLAALDHYQTSAGGPMLRALAHVHEDGRSVRDALRTLLLELVDEAVEDPERRGCLMVNAITERGSCDPDVARRGRAAVSGMNEVFTTLLRTGQDRGELDAGLDVADLSQFLVLTVQGLRVMGVTNPDRAVLTGAVDIALRVVR